MLSPATARLLRNRGDLADCPGEAIGGFCRIRVRVLVAATRPRAFLLPARMRPRHGPLRALARLRRLVNSAGKGGPRPGHKPTMAPTASLLAAGRGDGRRAHSPRQGYKRAGPR